MSDSVLSSLALVAASEMGDKTQLLAFALSARFRKPWPIMAGIFVATAVNHMFAALAGEWFGKAIPEAALGYLLGASFVGFGLWMLKADTDEDWQINSRFGVFGTTAILFFIAEMGDKTQLATAALGARYQSALAVTLGTTAGMMLSDGLAVFLGEKFTASIPMKWVRRFAAALFCGFGIATVWRVIYL